MHGKLEPDSDAKTKTTDHRSISRENNWKKAGKCVQRETCENFKDYFKIQSHDRVTRHNSHLLQIPKKKLKYAKNGFFSMGVTLYNELPTKARKIENFNAFRKVVFNLYM